MLRKIFTILVLPLIFCLAQPVFAVESEINFGSCMNPQWPLSQENTGNNHGVVDVDSFAGTDKIYKSGDNALQCLCTNSGQGYETKWLKVSSLSESQADKYTSGGWISVEDGSEWGLANAPYLAKNSQYACSTPVGGSSSNNASGDNPYKSVLGLASTGNSTFIFSLLLIGAASFVTGFTLKRFSK